VTFNGEVLSNWDMYPLDFTNLFTYFRDFTSLQYRHVQTLMTCFLINCGIIIILDGMETLQVTLLRRTLASSPESKCTSCSSKACGQ